MKRVVMMVLVVLGLCAPLRGDELEKGFAQPPHAAKPWVFWFWINGNISKEGITADLEALQRAGIGGLVWMEVSGMAWAPDGKVTGGAPEWHDCMQWAFRECGRLGLEFDLSVDFGYGSGGPHITPDRSMQKLYWSETELAGGKRLDQLLPKPEVSRKNLSAWLRPGASISANVLEQVEKIDSYRDIAVLAIPAPASAKARAYRIPELNSKDGTSWLLPRGNKAPALPPDAVTPIARVIDLTDHMGTDGRLAWDAPPGQWLILRCGHASNFKMTRPCPNAAIGLECDRLAATGIETHFDGFLKKIFTAAGPLAGKALTYVHVDSWEAGGQNWTATFPAEFRARRGYDLRPWLPVLAGRVVGSAELSERFLWDMRKTISEMIHDNYSRRLRELARPFGIQFSTEAYGHLCIDNLAYAGACDYPISEFWARGDGLFPTPGGYENSTKAMASAAHTYGRPVIGAESFTSDRGWRDHPFTLKAQGDKKYCEGLNRMIFHLSAHQAYDNMIPGLTHRQWGQHINRFNTWFPYMQPWMDYLTRCQYLLQQGRFVADVCFFPGEGAPLNVGDIKLALPTGYDFDHCSAELLLKLDVKDGRLVLPSGASYRYLVLPDTDRLTLPSTQKIRALVDAGARVIGGPRPKGAPGLTDFPRCDAEVEKLAAALWDAQRITTGKTMAEVFAQDKLAPDFEGAGLPYIHRRTGESDIYFVAHQTTNVCDITCTFRIASKRPELWDPETGAIRALPEFAERDGRTAIPLHFDPLQSWFVVFREKGASASLAVGAKNFLPVNEKATVPGPWRVAFDPKWGGPAQPVTFKELTDWSKRTEDGIKYFSGTAVYRKSFALPPSAIPNPQLKLFLDLGKVEVMARVRVNGKDCGIAWKPPYRVDISGAVRTGQNELEISVVNLWINRLVGDEQLPVDANWKDFETLLAWPAWFTSGTPRTSGRYTFTTCRHYRKDTPLVSSGLLGPVTLQTVQP